MEKRTFRGKMVVSSCPPLCEVPGAEPRPLGKGHKEGRFELIIIKGF